jgi:alpha-mannosidase
MISTKQMDRTVQKLTRFCSVLEDRLFSKVDEIPVSRYQTGERLHQIPEASLFTKCSPGDTWGGREQFCWFRGTYTPGPDLNGKRLYVYPKMAGNEGMLWVDGEVAGIFSQRRSDGSRGDHYSDLLTMNAKAGKPLDVVIEWYAGHEIIGTAPFETAKRDYTYQAGVIDVCLRDELFTEVLFDLRVLTGMAEALDTNNFRRADVLNALMDIHQGIYYDPENVDDESFREGLRRASGICKKILAEKIPPALPLWGLSDIPTWIPPGYGPSRKR